MPPRAPSQSPSIGCNKSACRNARAQITEACVMACHWQTRLNRQNEQIRQTHERHQNRIDELSERYRAILTRCGEWERRAEVLEWRAEVLEQKIWVRGLVIRIMSGWMEGMEVSLEDYGLYKMVFDEDVAGVGMEFFGVEGGEVEMADAQTRDG